MSAAVGWFFALATLTALCVDVAIARDAVRRGWFALAAFSAFAATCALVGLLFVVFATLINGGAS